MDINVGVIGKMIDEDVANAGKIEPARRDVGGDQKSYACCAEFPCNNGAHILREAGM